MCVKLNLKEDVAGASFMAFGASAPEIVISIITTIQEEIMLILVLAPLLGISSYFPSFLDLE